MDTGGQYPCATGTTRDRTTACSTQTFMLIIDRDANRIRIVKHCWFCFPIEGSRLLRTPFPIFMVRKNPDTNSRAMKKGSSIYHENGYLTALLLLGGRRPLKIRTLNAKPKNNDESKTEKHHDDDHIVISPTRYIPFAVRYRYCIVEALPPPNVSFLIHCCDLQL